MPPTHSRPGRQANSGLNDSAGPSEFSGRAHAGEHLAQHVVHGLAGSCGVAGLDRLQHLAMRVEIAHRVTEQRVGGRHAILQRRVDQRRERQEEAVPGGGKHRFM
ncbi:MAG: Hpt domain-containing protein, partial [Mesorhizobium sp.]